jgi:hypothetical protein
MYPEIFAQSGKNRGLVMEAEGPLDAKKLVCQVRPMYGAMREHYGYSRDEGFPESFLLAMVRLY